MKIDANEVLREQGADALRVALDEAFDPFADLDEAPPVSGPEDYHDDRRATKREATRPLTVFNAGRDIGDLTKLPPRPFLLGTIFCRGNASMLGGAGATGKTSVRIAQYLALATGQKLTGEHVFKRSRVLLLSFEDDTNELRRRIGAAMKHYRISPQEVDGWFYFTALSRADGKIAVLDKNGHHVVPGDLAENLVRLITDLHLDLIAFDPFKKAHSVEENDNTAMDAVMEVLTDLAKAHGIATDSVAHNNKAMGDPGDANRLRGASAQKDAARLVYTLTTMSREEAQIFRVDEVSRPGFVRFDRAKVNYGKPTATKWFRLLGVTLGNDGVDPDYPNGDEVQVAIPWAPPEAFDGMPDALLNTILDNIAGGMSDGARYSSHANAKSRAAWRVILAHAPEKPEGAAKEIIKAWMKSGLLIEEEYYDEARRETAKGLRVDDAKRPGTAL